MTPAAQRRVGRVTVLGRRVAARRAAIGWTAFAAVYGFALLLVALT